MSIENSSIEISVCMVTYNHEKYIKQSIESVLMQKTDFEFELIISNDFSTDSTSLIIHEIIQSHPMGFKIRYFNQPSNLGMHLNGEFVFKKAQGKYIAICEGDDYWTNSQKLQIQYNYLKKNTSCGLIHHDVNYLFEKNRTFINSYKKTKNIEISSGSITEKLIINNFISTLSVVFRKELLEYYFDIQSDQRNSFLMTDYFMWLLFSQKCDVDYINLSMATYRVLEDSASNSKNYLKKIKFLNSYCEIKYYFINKLNLNIIYDKIISQYKLQEAAVISIRYNKFDEAYRYSKDLNYDHYKKCVLKIVTFALYHFKILRHLIKTI